VPEGVDVRKVDLSIELQILAFHAQRKSVVQVPRHADHDLSSLQRRRAGLESVGTSGNSPAPGALTLNGNDSVAAEAVGR